VTPAFAPWLVGALSAVGILVAGGGKPLVWVLAAITGVTFYDLAKRGVAESARARSDRTAVAMSLGFFGVLLAGAFDLGASDGSVGFAGWICRAVGLAVIAAGFSLRVAAARALGSNFGVGISTAEDQLLVENGPYRLIRHPTYTALLLVGIGTAIALRSPLAFAVTLMLWLPTALVRMGKEEQMLLERFGAAYGHYCRRTWRLLPRVY
jgi:protein-S-isoprenylcysteine O-methyltransferase